MLTVILQQSQRVKQPVVTTTRTGIFLSFRPQILDGKRKKLSLHCVSFWEYSWQVTTDSFSALDTSMFPTSLRRSIIHRCVSRMSPLQRFSIKYLLQIISCSHWGLTAPPHFFFNSQHAEGIPNVPSDWGHISHFWKLIHLKTNLFSVNTRSRRYL